MRECLARYERAQAGSRRARFSRSADQGARSGARQRRGPPRVPASDSACSSSTSSRTPIRCRPSCCSCSPADDDGTRSPRRAVHRRRSETVDLPLPARRRRRVSPHRDQLQRRAERVPVTLQTSFRSVPAIQRFRQRGLPRRDDRRRRLAAGRLCSAAARIATTSPSSRRSSRCRCRGRTAEPYGRRKSRRRRSASRSRRRSPSSSRGWCRRVHVDRRSDAAQTRRRRIVAERHLPAVPPLLHFGDDVTRGYVEALEARGVPHLLVGGKTFHEREEVDAIRTALTAIEWPEDELSVLCHAARTAVRDRRRGAARISRARARLPSVSRARAICPNGCSRSRRRSARCASCMPRAIIGRSPTPSAA